VGLAPFRQRRPACLRTGQLAAAAPERTVSKPPPPISLTDAALEHLKKLRKESGGEDLVLRMGVKSGGCSGMSCEPRNIAWVSGLFFVAARFGAVAQAGPAAPQ
jgi:hypothetical protein